MDMYKEQVIEPLAVKEQIIRSATEAACMILRIDDVIASGKSRGRGGPPPRRHGRNGWTAWAETSSKASPLIPRPTWDHPTSFSSVFPSAYFPLFISGVITAPTSPNIASIVNARFSLAKSSAYHELGYRGSYDVPSHHAQPPDETVRGGPRRLRHVV